MISLGIYFLVIGSIIGWSLEMTFKIFALGDKTNAGISNGPFCILYGIGTFVLAIFLSRFTNNVLIVFSLSLIILTALEYITGVLLDKVYGVVLWDYSQLKFSINNYISLEFMIVWGILGVIFVLYLLPILNSIYNFYYGPLFSSLIYASLFVIVIDYLESSVRLIKEKNMQNE
jgi:uncharacterized membrane protein